MELEIIIALIALSGIFFSALFAVSSYFYKSNLETKRSGRRLLYLLLELRHTIITSLYDPKDITKQYLDRCEEFFNKKNLDINFKEIANNIEHIVYQQVSSMTALAHTEASEKLLAEYEHELLSFSAINPVLAYRLKGKQILNKFANNTIDYLNSANQKLSEVLDIKESIVTLDPVAEKYKNDTINDVIKDLNNDIIELAAYCGRRDLIASKKALAKSITPGKRIDFGELDTEFSQLMAQITEVLGKHHTDRPKTE